MRTFPPLGVEIPALITIHRDAILAVVEADERAVGPGRVLHFLNDYPGMVSFWTKFRRLTREIRASTRGTALSIFGNARDVTISRTDPVGDFYDAVAAIVAEATARSAGFVRGFRGPPRRGWLRAGIDLSQPVEDESDEEVDADAGGVGAPGWIRVGRRARFPHIPGTLMSPDQALDAADREIAAEVAARAPVHPSFLPGVGFPGSAGANSPCGVAPSVGLEARLEALSAGGGGGGGGTRTGATVRFLHENDDDDGSGFGLRGLALNVGSEGEIGSGPGVVREGFQAVAAALLASSDAGGRALFKPWNGDSDGGGDGGAGGVWYHVDPKCVVAASPKPWRFVGRFLGLAVASGCPVRFPIVPWLWSQILGDDGTRGAVERLRDAVRAAGAGGEEGGVGEADVVAEAEALLEAMAPVEPEFCRGLARLLAKPMADESNAWAIGELVFRREDSGESDVDDLQGGDNAQEADVTTKEEDSDADADSDSDSNAAGDVVVTDANKAKYVLQTLKHRAARHLGASTAFAVDAIRRGLADVIPLNALRGFTPEDLRRAVCGVEALCPREWRRATQCEIVSPAYDITAPLGGGGGGGGGGRGGGRSMYASSTAAAGGGGGGEGIVEWFWRAVESFTAERRANLLTFWTGAAVLGPNGFHECDFRLTLASHLSPESLPESQTCSRTIKLARYVTYEQLREKLVSAIEYGARGFAFA